MILTALLGMAIALMQAGAPAADAADTAELTRLERVWNESHLTGDAGALDRLWADELVVAVPRMPALDKAGGLAMWQSGRMKFQKYDTSGLRIRVYADSAVVTGRMERSRVRDGRWQVVAFHASEAGR